MFQGKRMEKCYTLKSTKKVFVYLLFLKLALFLLSLIHEPNSLSTNYSIRLSDVLRKTEVKLLHNLSLYLIANSNTDILFVSMNGSLVGKLSVEFKLLPSNAHNKCSIGKSMHLHQVYVSTICLFFAQNAGKYCKGIYHLHCSCSAFQGSHSLISRTKDAE